jgi:hypothetical protein
LLGLLNSTNDALPNNVVNAFQNMIVKETLNPADINQLYQAYYDPNPPPVSFIISVIKG